MSEALTENKTDDFIAYIHSVNKKTLVFLEVALRRRQVRGLDILKIKESRYIFCKVFGTKTNKNHNRDDCFQNVRNEELSEAISCLPSIYSGLALDIFGEYR